MHRAGSGGPLIAGAAFAIAWTPCVGPTLGSILSAAAIEDTVGKGGVLLAAYSPASRSRSSSPPSPSTAPPRRSAGCATTM